MSYMKNYMMDVEEFCDGYFFGDDGESRAPCLTYSIKHRNLMTMPASDAASKIEEIAEDAKKFFGSSMAKDYAVVYLTKTLGEI